LIRRVAGIEPPPTEPPPPSRTARREPVAASDLHRGSPSARFWWPTSGRVVRHYRAPLRGLPEPGVTISAPAGREVYCVAAGTVVTCLNSGRTPESGWGNVVAISHADGMTSWYAHLDQILTEPGRKVAKGEAIGTVGSSGAAAVPQLAFRMFRDERPVDPEEYLP
jgi:murein DD-endopeptidase MepM/ murein hydrolase activator NlpD